MSETTSGHTSRAKDPNIVREAQKPIEFIGRVFYTIALAIVVLALVLGVRGCRAQKTEAAEAAAKNARTHQYAPATPIAECSTPCTVPVQWAEPIKTGGRPVLVKFHGKTEWIRISGREADRLTLDQFSPGEADFASPDGTPVHVKIFPAR